MKALCTAVALGLLAGCTSSPGATPPNRASAKPENGAAALGAATVPSEPPPSDAESCEVRRSSDVDGEPKARSPQAALRHYAGDAAGFDAVVSRRGVEFYARDGSVAYVVERVGERWIVSVINTPACRPAALRRARTLDPNNLACKRHHFIIFGGPLSEPSVLEAMSWYLSRKRDPARRGPPTTGAYVVLERERHHFRFGHIDRDGLESVVSVWSDKRGTAVASVSWC